MTGDFLPPRPTGSSREARFDQATYDKTHGPSAQINSTSTVRVEKTTRGYRFHAKAPKGGSKSTISYQGTYDPTKTYNKGDIVRVMTGNSQGVWICVSDTALTNSPPVFPEPATLTPPQTNNWEMFAFGVQATAVCNNGSKTVYVNATPPL